MRVNRASLKILPRFEASMELWWRILFQWNWGRRDWRRVFYWAPAWFKVCGGVMKEAVWYHALWCQRWPMLGSLEAAGSPPQRSNYSRAWRKGGEEKKKPHKTCSRGHFNLGKMKECISRRAMKTSECLAALCSSHEIFREKEEGRRTHASERSRRENVFLWFFFSPRSFSLKERDLIMIQYTITLYDITAA